MPPYSFREATVEDLPLIINWTEALMEHESLPDNLELTLSTNLTSQLTDWLANLITDENSLLIMAVDDTSNLSKGIVIGYIQAQPNEFTIFEMHGVIQMVWVEKEIRKNGLAKELVNHMENTFKNLQVPYCEIQYSDSNIEATAFWKKMGYQLVSHNCRKFL